MWYEHFVLVCVGYLIGVIHVELLYQVPKIKNSFLTCVVVGFILFAASKIFN